MPGIAELRVPCKVKVQALSSPVKVGVEGRRDHTPSEAGSDLESRVAYNISLIHV